MNNDKELKTSYEGCHPVIAESLQRGEHIKCRVYWDDEDRAEVETVVAYVEGEDCPYIDADTVEYKHAEPIPKTETRVLQPIQLMQALIDAGHEVDGQGYWEHRKGEPQFNPEMWQYCGCKPRSAYTWRSSWLEEVEVG